MVALLCHGAATAPCGRFLYYRLTSSACAALLLLRSNLLSLCCNYKVDTVSNPSSPSVLSQPVTTRDPRMVSQPLTTPDSPMVSHPLTTPASLRMSHPMTSPEPQKASQPLTTLEPPMVSHPLTTPASLRISHPVTTPEPQMASQPLTTLESPMVSQPVRTPEPEPVPAACQLLGVTMCDQDVVEQRILQQVDQTLALHQHKVTIKQLKAVTSSIHACQQWLETNTDSVADVETHLQQLEDLKAQQAALLRERDKLRLAADCQTAVAGADCSLSGENDVAQRVRLGEMTPFGSTLPMSSSSTGSTGVWSYLQRQAQLSEEHRGRWRKRKGTPKPTQFKRKKARRKEKLSASCRKPSKGTVMEEDKDDDNSDDDGSEYQPSEGELEEISMEEKRDKVASYRKTGRRTPAKWHSLPEDWGTDDSDWNYSDEETSTRRRRSSKKVIDDGNMEDYVERLKLWDEAKAGEGEGLLGDQELEGGYKIPKFIWNKLYNYQRVGVQWLWELHRQQCGGILGDEMGLGKTVQVIAFLAGLAHSNLLLRGRRSRGLGPTLVVCPITVMHQWVQEFHVWWPPLRAAILHESGSYKGKREELVRHMGSRGGVLVTSYVGVVQLQDCLLAVDWHYIILDEGHKIRNPDAQVTLAVKRFRTPHRIVLSGSPMQNNLKELWSLFDFVFPGKLGTLPVFLAQLAVPITEGGYANASQVQVATAYRCATVLRDTITPYLLRRMKIDVKRHVSLPPKSEQVLFCRLTEEQRQYYKAYLDSGEVERILQGHLKIFVGLINLRKICNHPDLYCRGRQLFKGNKEENIPEEERYGHWKKSGKMIVVESLLKIWKKQGHRVLLFTQSCQMLSILEKFVQKEGYKYLKLDGTTSVGARQPLIAKYNQDTSYFVFLLTTRVGGLGINLTGADRVVIYDPDWNPATDTQARERAWRIGQHNQVTVYRLVTAGTIEEKVYHRQIFKQFLTNKVLQDPKQRRFFKSNDLFELFTLKESDRDGSTETAAIFAGTGSEVRLKTSTCKRTKELSENIGAGSGSLSLTFSASKLARMRKLAQKLSANFSSTSGKTSEERVGASASASANTGKSTEDEKKKKKKKKKKEQSSNKHHGQRKKKHKDSQFEGERVSHLVRHRVAKDTTVPEDKPVNADHDDYVLMKLFKKSGLQTALRHDTIMEVGPADYALVEGEAQRVAQEAVRALKDSRRHCWQASSGVPTWTGQSGALRSPCQSARSRPQFGKKKSLGDRSLPAPTSTTTSATDSTDKQLPFQPAPPAPALTRPMSSAELLARIRDRNRLLGAVEPGTSAVDSSMTEDDANVRLLVDIRNFVAFGTVAEGRASTQEIVDRFKDELPAGSSPLFRCLLSEVCNFQRTPSGEGIWKLKPEFRW